MRQNDYNSHHQIPSHTDSGAVVFPGSISIADIMAEDPRRKQNLSAIKHNLSPSSYAALEGLLEENALSRVGGNLLCALDLLPHAIPLSLDNYFVNNASLLKSLGERIVHPWDWMHYDEHGNPENKIPTTEEVDKYLRLCCEKMLIYSHGVINNENVNESQLDRLLEGFEKKYNLNLQELWEGLVARREAVVSKQYFLECAYTILNNRSDAGFYFENISRLNACGASGLLNNIRSVAYSLQHPRLVEPIGYILEAEIGAALTYHDNVVVHAISSHSYEGRPFYVFDNVRGGDGKLVKTDIDVIFSIGDELHFGEVKRTFSRFLLKNKKALLTNHSPQNSRFMITCQNRSAKPILICAHPFEILDHALLRNIVERSLDASGSFPSLMHVDKRRMNVVNIEDYLDTSANSSLYQAFRGQLVRQPTSDAGRLVRNDILDIQSKIFTLAQKEGVTVVLDLRSDWDAISKQSDNEIFLAFFVTEASVPITERTIRRLAANIASLLTEALESPEMLTSLKKANMQYYTFTFIIPMSKTTLRSSWRLDFVKQPDKDLLKISRLYADQELNQYEYIDPRSYKAL